jgi:predicted RNase H-like HicB family nuclease
MKEVSTYVALVDGKPGAFGVVFPDCPGCTAMGRTVEDALDNAAEALAEWAADVGTMPKPRSVAQVRRDPDVRQALADGAAVLAFVSLAGAGRIRHAQRPALRRRYA